jgi:hypothetical protein
MTVLSINFALGSLDDSRLDCMRGSCRGISMTFDELWRRDPGSKRGCSGRTARASSDYNVAGWARRSLAPRSSQTPSGACQSVRAATRRRFYSALRFGK